MIIRRAKESDANAISELIISVSQQFVLKDYSEEGQRNYLRSVDPVSILNYLRGDFDYYVAEEENEIIGVMAIRDLSHLYHLFVAGAHHGKGIARALWDHVLSACLAAGNSGVFTVNSSAFAVPAYLKMGFVIMGELIEKSGVISTPMQFRLPGQLADLSIETERLRLVPVSPEYREMIFQEFTSVITAFMYPLPAAEISMTDEFIALAQQKLATNEDYEAVVLDKSTGEFLGCAGIHQIFTATPELGIWIKESAHRNGYGKEAILGLKNWGDQHLNYAYMVYPVDDRNPASLRIPEEMGAPVARAYEIKNASGNLLFISEYHMYRNLESTTLD